MVRRSLSPVSYTHLDVYKRQHQLSYVTHSGEGEGLLFYGNTILPFIDHFPKDTELYLSLIHIFVVALGAGLGIWGAINLLEGYGNDNRAMRS